jgi:hypothetical protein
VTDTPDDTSGGRQLDPKTIVGLLADAGRRRVLAAVELGAGTLDEAIAATGLADFRVAKALGKLVDAHLITTTADGVFAVDGDAIARAARQALQRPRSTEHEAEPPAIRKVLDAFVRDGVINAMPASPSKRRILLDWLARRFEPGRRYPEADVTAMLDGHAEDAVTLRRYLIDESFLDRRNGLYWRSGGTVDVAEVEERPAL